ncbi:hypothetical protein BURPS668_A1339 [Burkholderia pseudomallei 668]|nr:hypothetical protein BURPS668_A1339 [Burkholderia pseudomallei 668]
MTEIESIDFLLFGIMNSKIYCGNRSFGPSTRVAIITGWF